MKTKIPHQISRLKNLHEIPKYVINHGVYFLCKNEIVVYVGQSKNPYKRITDHANKKDFDSAFVLFVDEEIKDLVESAFIQLLNPPNQGKWKTKEGERPCVIKRLSDDQAKRVIKPLLRRKMYYEK